MQHVTFDPGKCCVASQDVSRIKDDGQKQEDETHTLTRLISMGSMERDKPGVKGQDHFYCNKHFSMRALQGTGTEKQKKQKEAFTPHKV